MTRDVVAETNVELWMRCLPALNTCTLWNNLGIFRLRWCNGRAGFLVSD